MLEQLAEPMLAAREALWSEFAKLHREVLAIVKDNQVIQAAQRRRMIALINMDPEDGRLTVTDLDDEVSTTAFVPLGVENLKEFLADLKPDKALIATIQSHPTNAAVLGRWLR